MKLINKLMIAGPCGAESEEQMQSSIKQAKMQKVDFLRVNLWKPRTKPGFEGLQEDGLKFMVMAAKEGVNPATEVLLPEHAKKVLDVVLPATTQGKVLIWLGARNQNHFIQREVAKIVAMAGDRVYLMVKNQVWHNEKHWEGIIDHVLDTGFPKERLILCHRGFAPSNDNNPMGYRNVPDFEMAMRIKDRTGLPMVFDPSHTGGSVEKVFIIAKEAQMHQFDGYIIEVHPNPKTALSDANQQLNWSQYNLFLNELTKQRISNMKKGVNLHYEKN